jgi:hypothetical protein
VAVIVGLWSVIVTDKKRLSRPQKKLARSIRLPVPNNNSIPDPRLKNKLPLPKTMKTESWCSSQAKLSIGIAVVWHQKLKGSWVVSLVQLHGGTNCFSSSLGAYVFIFI